MPLGGFAGLEQLTRGAGGGVGGGGLDEFVQIPIPDTAYALRETPPQNPLTGRLDKKKVTGPCAPTRP